MGSSLARLDRGEEANVETMKILIKRYEEITKERGNSSDDSGEGATGSIIPSMSDQALYRELEQALVAASTTSYGEATPSNGAPRPSRSSGSGSGSGSGSTSSESSSRDGAPSTVQHRQRHRHRHQHQCVPAAAEAATAEAATAAAAAASAPGARRAPSVLVVDDSSVSCQIAKRGLSNSNIGVEVAKSGELALKRLDCDPSGFDLVLLDVAMPGLDGLQVLDRMKQDPRLCHLPVVVLSGLEDERIADACKQHGAVDVLRKPMSTSEVVRMVNAHCCSMPPASARARVSGSSSSGDTSPAHDSATAFPPPPPPPSPPPPGVSAISVASALDAATCGSGSGSGKGSGGDTVSSFTLAMSDKGGLGETRVVPSSAQAGSHAEAAAAAPAAGVAALERASGNATGARRPEEPSSTLKVTILVVDDSVISSRLAVHKLRSLGYETLAAMSGKAALELLRKHPHRVSFVLLDIIMPVMNGIELLQVLKTDPALRHIPVLVVSSLEKEYLDDLSVGSGMMAVLNKPLDVEELQQIVTREGLALPTPPPSSQASSQQGQETEDEEDEEALTPMPTPL